MSYRLVGEGDRKAADGKCPKGWDGKVRERRRLLDKISSVMTADLCADAILHGRDERVSKLGLGLLEKLLPIRAERKLCSGRHVCPH